MRLSKNFDIIQARNQRRALTAAAEPGGLTMAKKLEDYVVTIPDFPQPGIMFRDITSVIQDPDGLRLAVDGLVDAPEFDEK